MHASKSLVAHAFVSLIDVFAGPTLAPGPDFEREIQPLLAEHCAHCHGSRCGSSRERGVASLATSPRRNPVG